MSPNFTHREIQSEQTPEQQVTLHVRPAAARRRVCLFVFHLHAREHRTRIFGLPLRLVNTVNIHYMQEMCRVKLWSHDDERGKNKYQALLEMLI